MTEKLYFGIFASDDGYMYIDSCKVDETEKRHITAKDSIVSVVTSNRVGRAVEAQDAIEGLCDNLEIKFPDAKQEEIERITIELMADTAERLLMQINEDNGFDD